MFSNASASTSSAPLPVTHGVRTIVTMEELDRVIEAQLGNRPVLLQLTAEWCHRCPGFAEAVRALADNFEFEWLVANVANTELTELFDVRKLPAFVLCKRGQMPIVKGDATPRDLNDIVQSECKPMLTLDADF